jgi:hypothetical protein
MHAVRKFLATVKVTAVEILDDSLSLLVFLSAAGLSILAPALHYHQFGEPSRMARDAGLSALFAGGLIYIAFASVRSFRREIETNTISVVLSHPISRRSFLLSKFFGSLLAFSHYVFSMFFISIIMINGAEIGGGISRQNGDIARIYGPSFAMAVISIILPLMISAILNRMKGCRFALTFNFISMGMLFASMFFRFDFWLFMRVLPVALCAMLPHIFVCGVLISLAVKFKLNVSISAASVVFVAMIPFIGSYYLPESLSKGGTLSWMYLLVAFLSLLPLVFGVLYAGIRNFEEKEI